MVIVGIPLQGYMTESAAVKSFYCKYGGLEMFGISCTLSGVSAIETRHLFAIVRRQSVDYDKIKRDLQIWDPPFYLFSPSLPLGIINSYLSEHRRSQPFLFSGWRY